MGAVTWVTAEICDELVTGTSALAQTIAVGIPVLAGAASYLGFAALFKVEELSLVKGLFSRGRSADTSGEPR